MLSLLSICPLQTTTSARCHRACSGLTRGLSWLLLLWVGVLAPASAQAQLTRQAPGAYTPFNQMMPPGMAGQWGAAAGHATPPYYFQPVQVTVPSTGTVTFYDQGFERPIDLSSPAQAGVVVGPTYRLKLTDLPEFPGVEFYPTLELVDRLHPPASLIERFPVQILFDVDELDAAARGRLITKVIYLEQPDLIPLAQLNSETRVMDLAAAENVFSRAEQLGRPLVLVRLGGRLPDPHRPDPGFFGPGGPVQLSQQLPNSPAGEPVTQTAGRALANPAGIMRREIIQTAGGPLVCESCPPSARQPVWGENPAAVGMPICDVHAQTSAKHYPDEYLCDGGDRGWPVHYPGGIRDGLDTEDTVAEFTDHTGRERTAPASRVCVYAPRSAAVRVISLPHEGSRLDEIAGLGNSSVGQSLRTKVKSNGRTQLSPVGNVRVESRMSGLASEALQGAITQAETLALHEKLLNTFEDLSFFRSGQIARNESAIVQLGQRAAIEWSRNDSPLITAKLQPAVEGLSEQVVATITLIDDRPSNKPGQLRVVKLADRKDAVPGEEIQFTIRYDNSGPRELSGVRIVDNLTPRLEYIEGSATSDRDGELIVEDNGEGSVILIWQIDGAIAKGQGGVVSFKARVR